jgi:hypothetical protein
MSKKILSVGFEIPGGGGEYVPYKSDRSLLDADIIIFQPDISHFFTAESYQGLRSFSEDTSFQMQRTADHWQSELLAALKEGKTIVVFLSQFEKFFLDSGQRNYSGTGRNQKVTRLVNESNNYKFLPLPLGDIVPARGEVIKKVGDLGFLAPYWSEFADDSHYELYFNGKVTQPLLTAGASSRVVGALVRVKNVAGSLVLLPYLDTDRDEFSRYDEKQKSNLWTKEAREFGKRLVSAIIGVDSQLRKELAATPEPGWAAASDYKLSTEEVELEEIARCDVQIRAAQTQRNEAVTRLENERSLRALLYETGKPLEDAIRDSLDFLGFKAEPYKDGTSEFDVIFSSAEGRLLGEAEGKDNKAINIDKFSQLERNLHEDFARESISEMAKGVLFGNAFRLLPLQERQEFFTLKCISAAQRIGAALVRTPDLFTVVQSLKRKWDDSYAEECRRAILTTRGEVVIFPIMKAPSSPLVEVQAEPKIA